MHKLVEKWAIYRKETQPTNRQWKNTELKWWDNILILLSYEQKYLGLINSFIGKGMEKQNYLLCIDDRKDNWYNFLKRNVTVAI